MLLLLQQPGRRGAELQVHARVPGAVPGVRGQDLRAVLREPRDQGAGDADLLQDHAHQGPAVPEFLRLHRGAAADFAAVLQEAVRAGARRAGAAAAPDVRPVRRGRDGEGRAAHREDQLRDDHGRAAAAVRVRAALLDLQPVLRVRDVPDPAFDRAVRTDRPVSRLRC